MFTLSLNMYHEPEVKLNPYPVGKRLTKTIPLPNIAISFQDHK